MLKQYVSADRLLRDSCELGLRIAQSGYRPTMIAGIWRGGTPVAVAVQEIMEFLGIRCDHIAIRTSSYSGMEQRAQVTVHGLDYLHRLTPQDRLLLVDDVHDTGQSINQVIKELYDYFGNQAPAIRIAMPYFKPLHNVTGRIPDFFLHTTEDWLVFPHELQGLTDAEVMEKQGLQELAPRLLRLRDQMAQPNSVKESS